MSTRGDGESSEQPPSTGPYTLVNLLTDISLTEDDEEKHVYITCVEFWNDNLYIGTSAAELLHYVLIPPASESQASETQFILASRLQPEYSEISEISPGVQQILVLPGPGKACILCNGTLTFYSLPEFSPAYGESAKVERCTWIGGIDDDNLISGPNEDGSLLMICVERRIRLIRIGDRPRKVRSIELPGCLRTARSGTIACVADSRSYSLLEVVEQQQIPLFEINPQQGQEGEEEPNPDGKPLPSPPTHDDSAPQDAPHTHEFSGDNKSNQEPTGDASTETSIPPRTSSLATSQHKLDPSNEADQRTSHTTHSRQSSTFDQKNVMQAVRTRLKPNIVKPSESEFLLTTGTSKNEPGVGIFVNLDGDVVRGTIQFSRYPETIVTDSRDVQQSSMTPSVQPNDGSYVLAIITREEDGTASKLIEVQRLDTDQGDDSTHYLDPTANPLVTGNESNDSLSKLGLTRAESSAQVPLPGIAEKLRLTPLEINVTGKGSSEPDSSQKKDRKLASELGFAQRLSRRNARLLMWTADSVWWIIRSPQVLHLDSTLDQAIVSAVAKDALVDRRKVEDVLRLAEISASQSDSQNELDFLGVRYIRQKASLMLFYDLLKQTSSGIMSYERDRGVTEKILAEGDIDPRIIIASIDQLRGDIKIDSNEGLWIQNGLQEVWNKFDHSKPMQPSMETRNVSWENLLHVVKRYLMHWRRKKGYASVADDRTLFQSVDTALLQILLMLDMNNPPGRAVKGSVRSELNALVDEGVDDFERAAELLEQYQRLYTLSRLHQSRRQYAKVLGTWRRIVDGDPDMSGELGNGEEEIRDYLILRKDRALVLEYGTWLALRNPRLGVQIFADPKSHIKFEPREVVDLLKARAPNAVKEYLELLVFGNNLAQYANDLIGYYLDSVLHELDSSKSARDALATSYGAYRALSPPKPTYSQFAADNAVDAAWWRNRLRLLQLLGGSHSAASQYDTTGILKRVESYGELLVPETIILSGRQGQHEEAIRLLTHGLGDFDTAVSYCVLGGSSTYSSVDNDHFHSRKPPHEEQMRLFRCLLQEFLNIKGADDRITQTSELLGRFSRWFEIEHVISTIPEAWSVENISAFLESALRVLQSERAESMVVRALTSSENLSYSAKVVEKVESLGASLEARTDDTSVNE